MSKEIKLNNIGNYQVDLPMRNCGEQPKNSTGFSKWSDPNYWAQQEMASRMQESNRLDLKSASSLVSANKTWLYPNFLLEGELTILAGSPCDGKTTLACLLAAGITIGKDYLLYPGLMPIGNGHVIIVNREDDDAKSLKVRLEVVGVNPDMVHFIGGAIGRGDNSSFSFSNERDINRLVGLAERLDNNIALLIIDPIYFAVDGDQNSDHKARVAYEKLTVLAKRLSCAILGIAHTVRNTKGKDVLGRIAGPPALRQVPRQIILLSKILNGPTETGATHVLVHAKNSEGSMDGGFEYRIEIIETPCQNGTIQTPKFVITRQLYGGAEKILEKADCGIAGEKTSKFDDAVNFLQTVLKDGPLLWVDIEKLAEESGVKKGTLMNAKSFLKIEVAKVTGNKGRSEWRLPNNMDTINPID